MDRTSFRPISPARAGAQPFSTIKAKQTAAPFALQLQNAIGTGNSLTVSKHARERLIQRNINISPERWNKIGTKVQEARKMGVNDSLVLLTDAALIISAKNNTVITAMGREEASSQIFTNINGTILMD